LVMASLQANQHFLLPAMAPLLYNLGQIFGAVILAPGKGLHIGQFSLPAFNLGVYGLVYGVILGAIFHLLIQIPGLVKYKFHWEPRLELNHPMVRQSLSVLGPRILTMLFIQFIFIARDSLGSFTGAGAISALTYGWMILQVPETLIGSTIGTALLPTISEQISRNDWHLFHKTIEQAIQVILAITLPLTLILGLGLQPLVNLAFGPKFVGNQMIMLMGVIQAFLAGLAGQCLLEVAVRGFYAQKNAILPLIVSGLNAVFFVGFAFIFRIWLGTTGIALALSLSYTGEATLLLWFLNHRLPEKLAIKGTLIRSLAAAALGGGLVWIIMNGISLPIQPYEKAVLGLVAGAIISLPLIRRELHLLVKL